MLFTAGTALAKSDQMLLLLGWVVLARRGLLFRCQQRNVHLHEVFVTCSLIARGFSVVPMATAVFDEQHTRWVPGFVIAPSATSPVRTNSRDVHACPPHQ